MKKLILLSFILFSSFLLAQKNTKTDWNKLVEANKTALSKYKITEIKESSLGKLFRLRKFDTNGNCIESKTKTQLITKIFDSQDCLESESFIDFRNFEIDSPREKISFKYDSNQNLKKKSIIKYGNKTTDYSNVIFPYTDFPDIKHKERYSIVKLDTSNYHFEGKILNFKDTNGSYFLKNSGGDIEKTYANGVTSHLHFSENATVSDSMYWDVKGRKNELSIVKFKNKNYELTHTIENDSSYYYLKNYNQDYFYKFGYKGITRKEVTLDKDSILKLETNYVYYPTESGQEILWKTTRFDGKKTTVINEKSEQKYYKLRKRILIRRSRKKLFGCGTKSYCCGIAALRMAKPFVNYEIAVNFKNTPSFISEGISVFLIKRFNMPEDYENEIYKVKFHFKLDFTTGAFSELSPLDSNTNRELNLEILRGFRLASRLFSFDFIKKAEVEFKTDDNKIHITKPYLKSEFIEDEVEIILMREDD
jgi:hypothetical protein